KPYVMAGINVFAADTNEEARLLASSLYTSFLNVIRGTRYKLMPPVEDMSDAWSESERYAVEQMLSCTFVGDPDKIRSDVQDFVDQSGVNELVVASQIYDHRARLYSYQLLAEAGIQKAVS